MKLKADKPEITVTAFIYLSGIVCRCRLPPSATHSCRIAVSFIDVSQV